jgi:type III secretory pathway component EscT
MIAGLIFVVSSLTLLQFFVSYSRSIITESRGHTLSEQARELCGIRSSLLAGEQFGRLNQLMALCPEANDDGFKVKAVGIYFHLLGFARTFIGWAIPSADTWIETERGGCAYVAAVVLDRRIAHNRMMVANLASH